MWSIGKRVKKLATDFLDLPKDALLDVPRVTLIGGLQAYVENFHSVMEFSDKQLRLQLTKGQLIIKGSTLEIKRIVDDQVMIEGQIDAIQYVQ
ncbi:sporulation protein YqfC [Fodinisporobacter ferrooxydans]|uniref:Sporulation protein YqfC n=1 Tax=Fodinisporobacter ferrooxydans TaxID=2901836 RepID=A0ABY4CIE1_9BACL|nr:sporulation protein YqfC [Alicyclobacillaceae bacterium MYW30-H2]